MLQWETWIDRATVRNETRESEKAHVEQNISRFMADVQILLEIQFVAFKDFDK
jgi:hypothetical protein